mmetsp:Transcript_91362/g.263715  ORF Transcript_91362/g.263715 Transcript_91362/m.263715 type:complete len:283 (-) Transcript_91362:1100-1948(-)
MQGRGVFHILEGVQDLFAVPEGPHANLLQLAITQQLDIPHVVQPCPVEIAGIALEVQELQQLTRAQEPLPVRLLQLLQRRRRLSNDLLHRLAVGQSGMLLQASLGDYVHGGGRRQAQTHLLLHGTDAIDDGLPREGRRVVCHHGLDLLILRVVDLQRVAEATSAPYRGDQLLRVVGGGDQDPLLGAPVHAVQGVQQTVQCDALVHLRLVPQEAQILANPPACRVEVVDVFEQYDALRGHDRVEDLGVVHVPRVAIDDVDRQPVLRREKADQVRLARPRRAME